MDNALLQFNKGGLEMIGKLICKLFGHDWIFPYGVMMQNKRRIRPSDYRCSRCPAKRDKLMMEELSNG